MTFKLLVWPSTIHSVGLLEVLSASEKVILKLISYITSSGCLPSVLLSINILVSVKSLLTETLMSIDKKTTNSLSFRYSICLHHWQLHKNMTWLDSPMTANINYSVCLIFVNDQLTPVIRPAFNYITWHSWTERRFQESIEWAALLLLMSMKPR